MKKKQKEWSLRYLNQEYAAMRWLAKQGLTPEEIREFSWGKVDETEKVVKIQTKIFSLRYDSASGQTYRQESVKEVKVPIIGSGHEWFFLKSGIYNVHWMFTAHPPKSWRREKGIDALFPLEEVKRCCRDLQIQPENPLTNLDANGNIEISKLNIQKSKTVELVEEAEIVTEAND